MAYSHKMVLYGLEYTPYTEGQKKEVISDRSSFKKLKITLDDNKIFINEETPIKLMVKNDIKLLIGGYWDGRLVVQNFTKNSETIKKKHLFRITMIEVSESENIVITGTEKGDIVKWVREDNNLKYDKPFFHHQGTVTGAWIQEDMGIFATCSKDSTVNLYTISPPYILRSFRQPCGDPLKRVIISEAPLASIIMMNQEMKKLHSFSINGKYLTEYTDTREIINPLIITDCEFNERVVYGTCTGKLMVVKLPYFEGAEEKPWIDKTSVTPLVVSPDKRILIYYHVGLWCIGDFVTNIPQVGKEFPNIIDVFRRK